MSMKHWSKFLVLLSGVLLACGVFAQEPAKKATESIKIECEYSELNMGTHVFICKTNVTVFDPPGTQIKCETLTANLSTNNNDFKVIYADGNVVITITDKDGEKIAKGQHAVYEKETDVMTLTGEPVLSTTMGSSKGMDRVIYDRKKNLLIASGGRQTAVFYPKKVSPQKAEGTSQPKP